MTGIKPEVLWYVATNDFMGPTLMRTDNEKVYFMTDSSTYYAKNGKLKNPKVLFSGDPLLLNVFHAMGIPEGKKSGEVYTLVTKFINFIGSDRGQRLIGEFGKKTFGSALYMNAESVSDVKQ